MRSSVKRRDTGPDFKTRLDVLSRDGHRCVRCGEEIRGVPGWDFHIHHRRVRGMGGSKRADVNSPANLITLCPPCHEHVHSNVAHAHDKGWLLWQNSDPQAVAVLVDAGRRWVYLDDEAAYVDSRWAS